LSDIAAIFRASYAMGFKTTKLLLLLAALIFRKGGPKFLVVSGIPGGLPNWRECSRFSGLPARQMRGAGRFEGLLRGRKA